MTTTLEITQFDDVPSFVKTINAMRLKKGWYYFTGTVRGKRVEVKGYNTWLQIYRIDGINHANCSDRNVGEFKFDLANPFTR